MVLEDYFPLGKGNFSGGMLNFRSVLGERVSTSAILDDSDATFSGVDFRGGLLNVQG